MGLISRHPPQIKSLTIKTKTMNYQHTVTGQVISEAHYNELQPWQKANYLSVKELYQDDEDDDEKEDEILDTAINAIAIGSVLDSFNEPDPSDDFPSSDNSNDSNNSTDFGGGDTGGGGASGDW